MDISATNSKVSPDLARESLIAISQAIPEKAYSPDSVPVKSAVADLSDVGDKAVVEDFRSKLISISYCQSPDAQPLPSPEENPGI